MCDHEHMVEYRGPFKMEMPASPRPCFHNPSQAINCIMKLYWIESRTANSADVVWLWKNSCSNNPSQNIYTQRNTHTFPAQNDSSQKFKASTELILNPTACTSKDVGMSKSLFTKSIDRFPLVWCYQLMLRLGTDFGARVLYLSWADYSQLHGGKPRGLGGKQPRPEKTRQALMPSIALWINTFLGDTSITWHIGSRSHVCGEELFNLEDCSFDGAS